MKYCPRCQQAKDLDLFNKNRTTGDGLCSYCRECVRALNTAFAIKANAGKEFKRPFGRDQRKDAVSRFEARYAAVPFSGCWIWLGATAAGYGVFKPYDKRNYGAHRFAYELKHGAIPAGLLVCHRCDVKVCVNPDHLFVGTAADNTADMLAKGRSCGPLRALAKAAGINYYTFHSRVRRLGWSIERALTEPSQRRAA